MNILYLSCHSVLEHDEVALFTELGHSVFSPNGAYMNPSGPGDIKRPSIPGGYYNDHLVAVAMQCSKENLHEELIEWSDVIIVMHKPEWVTKNWKKISHKKVVWRSIGQSTGEVEGQLYFARSQGLKIVRYSPQESQIPNFMGAEAVIRFYKDPEEFKDWNGTDESVITVVQAMKSRGEFCYFDLFDKVTSGFNRKLFGPHNEDSGIPGGLLSYEALKQAYRDHRCYFYTGTYPASYTLNFMEAFMTGIPIVALGPNLANVGAFDMDTYEVSRFIRNGENGFCGDTVSELRGYIDYLLAHPEEAAKIGKKGRETAIELFGKPTIKQQWKDFLDNV